MEIREGWFIDTREFTADQVKWFIEEIDRNGFGVPYDIDHFNTLLTGYTRIGVKDGCVYVAWSDEPFKAVVGWRKLIPEDFPVTVMVGDINDEDINTDAPPSKYHVRNIWQGEEWLDFYTVWDAIKLGKTYQVGDSAIDHAMKKGFAIGERSGGKSRIQDLKEMIWSLERAVELIEAQE